MSTSVAVYGIASWCGDCTTRYGHILAPVYSTYTASRKGQPCRVIFAPAFIFSSASPNTIPSLFLQFLKLRLKLIDFITGGFALCEQVAGVIWVRRSRRVCDTCFKSLCYFIVADVRCVGAQLISQPQDFRLDFLHLFCIFFHVFSSPR